ncbi:MAG: hypothetical protein KQ78_01636 [Candidatus Izimaplasma bacterium HR2]|nr:MAG: hypothetical protein KQ78_01636 [Candidatus Izimaplasma bacterium HR2]
MKYTKFLIPIVLYIVLFIYTEFQETEVAVSLLYLNITLYFIYLLSLEFYSKKNKNIYYGFLISLFSFIVVNIIIVAAYFAFNGINTDNQASTVYIDTYNNEQYFQNIETDSGFSLGIYKQVNEGLVLFYKLEKGEYFSAIVDGKLLIQSYDFKTNPVITNFYLVDIETKVISLVPLNVVAPRYKSITDTHIIFYSYLSNQYYIYDALSNTIVHEYLLDDKSRYSDQVYYINNNLYINNGSNLKIEIYNFETETLDEIDYSAITDEQYLIQVYIKSIYSEVFIYSVYETNLNERIIIKSDDNYNVLSEFIVPFGYEINITEENIIQYICDSDQELIDIQIYDLDLNLTDLIELEETCQYVSIIGEETIQCSNNKERGAIFYREYRTIELFSIILGESVYDSGWIKKLSK